MASTRASGITIVEGTGPILAPAHAGVRKRIITAAAYAALSAAEKAYYWVQTDGSYILKPQHRGGVTVILT